MALVGEGVAPADVFAVPLEGSSQAAVDAAIDQVAAHQGEPTVLVTVPGPGSPSSILRSDVDDFTAHLDRQLTLSFAAARRVAPSVVAADQGRIVFVSAVSALVGAGWESATGAAMAGLIGLCRSLARELAPSGATVNVVAAGAIETQHLVGVAASGSRSKAMVDGAIARTPLKRLGQPEEVAWVVDYLASPEASYLTGVVLPADGGLGMGFG